MLNLVLTTDKLQLVTTSVASVDVQASFIDLSGTTITPGNQNTAISSATTTDIVAAPGASTTRNVKTLHVRNKAATLSVNIIVVFDANGTDYELHEASLAPGESCEYVEGLGFFCIRATPKLNQWRYVPADSVHTTAAFFTSVLGLSWPVVAGKRYTLRCALFHIANATTNGSQFAIGGVAMTDMVLGAISTVTNSATSATMSTGVVTAVNTAVVVQTTGAAANAPTLLAGSFQPSADGEFQVRAAPEVSNAAGLTIRQGSWAHIRETDN
jgi:hypothetical protein